MRVRIGGSRNPYYDPAKHFGCYGVELMLAKGVEIELGKRTEEIVDSSQQLIFVNIGQMMVTVPHEQEIGRGFASDTIVNLCGGISTTLRLTFAPDSDVSHLLHSQIRLKDPQFVSDSEKPTYDALRGFRAKHVSVDVTVQSPTEMNYSLLEPINCININSRLLEVLDIMIPMVQSPVLSIQIRKGKVFDTAEVQRPKFEHVFKTIRFYANMNSILSGMSHDFEAGLRSVGVRIKAGSLVVSSLLEKQLYKERKPELNLQRTATKWDLKGSEIIFTDYEARAFQADLRVTQGKEMEDIDDWKMGENDNIENMKLIPFVWAPKFIYYKKSDDLKIAAQKLGGKPRYHESNGF